ncbi:hypothetical protein TWF191_008175 [Orbilia oligospora]|uniref:Uncharacterized protein n=1 Tax=Orbilia oligospora TaxID=2813651 RepID=A0A7C8QQA9_ORBOL|nr:hypothetical protein TWF191_008175 [Orbilia oligospora]
MHKPKHESYPRARDRDRDRFNDHDPYYFRGRRTVPNMQSLLQNTEKKELTSPHQSDKRVNDQDNDITSSLAANQFPKRHMDKRKKNIPPSKPAQTLDSNIENKISATSSPSPLLSPPLQSSPSKPQENTQENTQEKHDMGSSKASSQDGNQDLTIGGQKLLEAPPSEGPLPPKNTLPSLIPTASKGTSQIRPFIPQIILRPPPQKQQQHRQLKLKNRSSSSSSSHDEGSLLSCEREYLSQTKQPPKPKKSNKEDPPAPWGQDIPYPILPKPSPDEGIKIFHSETLPNDFNFPICEAWLQCLTDGNIRFPYGRIHHPPPSSVDTPFGLIIKISIPSDKYYVFHCHDLIEFATIWLKEFHKVQNKYLPQLQSMNALKPGNFTVSEPMFYGVHDPNPTKGERDFISPYVRGVWTGERVEYNRATFLSKMFEECPSTEGKVNMAVIICLMTIYSRKEVTVITSLGQLVEKSRESLFVPEGWVGRCLSDSGYSRLVTMTDDFFRYVYMRFRRLHKISPIYEYKSIEKQHEGLKPLARVILRRDGKEDVLGRKTPIHWKRMRSDDYLLLLKKCIIEGERNDARREQIRQSTKSNATSATDNSQAASKWDSTASTKVEDAELSCCTIFPMGKVDITKELHDDYPHEDQLLWFLLTLYHPTFHTHLAPLLTGPQNAILTTPNITTGIHDFKAWLDPYTDSEDEKEDQKSPPATENPHFEKIFQKKKETEPTTPLQTDATYKLYCQCFEAHLAEGCYPVPTYGWEMYPHLVYFKAREGIPLPSPEIINLHRAIAIAATESGAWGAGDEILAAEEKKWHQCCKTYEPHYCLISSMKFPEREEWKE